MHKACSYREKVISARSPAWCKVLRQFTDDGEADDDADSSDEEFHYPGSSPFSTIRPSSRQSSATDYFNRPTTSRGPADLTPQLSQAPEFRVPTHDAPQKVLTPTRTRSTPHQAAALWERDETVHECRDCRRRFNFLVRRVGVPSSLIITYFKLTTFCSM